MLGGATFLDREPKNIPLALGQPDDCFENQFPRACAAGAYAFLAPQASHYNVDE
jgi:hypothetical protein